MTDRRYQAIDLAIKAGKLELADAIYSWLETGSWPDGVSIGDLDARHVDCHRSDPEHRPVFGGVPTPRANRHLAGGSDA